jgi:hypothetical protein
MSAAEKLEFDPIPFVGFKAGLINKQIPAVMRDSSAISKSRRNTQGSGYNFRGIDDVYNELHEPMAKHGIFTVPEVLEDRSEERSSKSGGTLIYRILRVRYWFFAEDGSYVTAVVIGEGMDSGDKASNKAMAAAHKYVLLQVFCIPTEDTKDSETETHEVAPRQQQQRAANAAPVDPKEKYEGTEPQRDFMRGIFAKYKITKNDDKHSIANDVKGMPLSEIDAYVRKLVAPA